MARLQHAITVIPTPSWTPQCLITLLFFLGIVWGVLVLFFARRTRDQPFDDPKRRPVPVEAYHIPMLGHTLSLALDGDRFLKSLRDKYLPGIFSLILCGTRHHVLFEPGLIQKFFSQDEKADVKKVASFIGVVVFGLPADEVSKIEEANEEMHELYRHLTTEESVKGMVDKTINKMVAENIKQLVTGSDRSQQRPWEQDAEVKKAMNMHGKPVVEASLFPLIRNFIAHMSSPSIMGSDFVRNYPNDFFTDVFTVDESFFVLLVASIFRWLPIPVFTKPRRARERILERLSIFHIAMEKKTRGEDPGPEWANLDDVGPLVRARMSVYQKYGWSMRARAANEHSLNWAANANSNSLTFWMLIRIFMDNDLLQELRSAVAPYIRRTESDNDTRPFVDIDGLLENCPLLKSCYIECLRVHTASWSFKMVNEDFTLQARKESGGWLLQKGDYCHAAHELHNTDPRYFDQPFKFNPARHMRFNEDAGHMVADMGTIRPYGGGKSMCKGRHFALHEVLAVTAVIFTMWDIEPAGGGDWKLPSRFKTTATYATRDPYRVWMSPRTGI